MSLSHPAYRFLLPLLLLAVSLISWTNLSAQEDTSTHPLHDALIEALENEEAREQLLQTLRAERSSSEAPSAPAAEPDAPAAEDPGSAPRRIADWTQTLAENGVDSLSILGEATTDITQALRTLDGSALGTGLAGLALLIGFTMVVFWSLRRVASPGFSGLDHWVIHAPQRYRLLRALPAVVLAGVIDFLVVLLAWVAGYGLALFVLGESGEMLTLHSLLLNAFLLIEATKAALRIIFATRYPGLRLLPMPGDEATYWNAWLARLTTYIGYGLLLLVPLANSYISSAAGRILGLLVMLTAFLYAAIIILQNRSRVHDRLMAAAQQGGFAFTRIVLTLLANSWHWIALLYFLALAMISIIWPEEALPFMAKATGQTLLAIFLGLFMARLLAQIIGREFRLADAARTQFPLLEIRLNAYAPKALKILNLVILLITLAVIADAWNLFNLTLWLTSDSGLNVIGTTLSVALILLAALALWLIFVSWTEHRLNPSDEANVPGAREKTLLSLFRNAIAITLTVVTLMIVLAEIGINIGPLLAGAGVLGLAVGFGSQKLVQDIITGVFIQLENAINTGDIVTVANVTGTVEKLTVRSMGLRDLSGTYHLIPFSAVDMVSNFMREFAFHVGEYRVSYREDIDEVTLRLREAFEELKNDPDHGPNILDDMEIHGVTALADSSVNIRIRIKTLPGTQFGLGRAFNRLVKRHFDAAGIEIPGIRQILYFGEDKNGARQHLPWNPSDDAATTADQDAAKDPRTRRHRRHDGDDGEPEDPGGR